MSKHSGKTKRVTWEKAMDQLGALISDKIEDVKEGVDRAVTKTAKQTASDIRDTTKYLYEGHGVHKAKLRTVKRKRKDGSVSERKRFHGTYRAHFDQKKMASISKSKSDFRRIVYVRSPEYRLTHLLENGHNIVDKMGRKVGSAKPVKHFAPAQEQAGKYLQKYAKQEVKTSLG